MTTPAALDAIAAALAPRFGRRVERDAPIAPLTTYRLGGPAGLLVRVGDPEDLAAVAAARVQAPAVPLVTIGRGSNLVVADTGFPGIVVVLEGTFEAVEVGEDSVCAGGAVPLPVLARRAAAAGRGGLEFYVGIPGSVGGAVRMNAGGHGRQTADVLGSAVVADLAGTGTPTARAVAALDLAYRHSNLRPDEIVTGADFTVVPDEPAACEARLAEIVRWRREHQPGGANAGSVFRNPEGDSAGRIIEAAGLKGLRVGGAVVSEKHANFIQAETGATAADVAALLRTVRTRVAESAGIVLTPELHWLGAGGWDAEDPA
ncbi:MAG: UDP-N-acetylmuramate dehydrogenase [Actinomycetes bacterium]